MSVCFGYSYLWGVGERSFSMTSESKSFPRKIDDLSKTSLIRDCHESVGYSGQLIYFYTPGKLDCLHVLELIVNKAYMRVFKDSQGCPLPANPAEPLSAYKQRPFSPSNPLE